MNTPVILTGAVSLSDALETAGEAKEWAYVGKWLASKNCMDVLSIEQNIDTLRSFFILAAGNETADEERELAFKFEGGILESLQTTNALLDKSGVGVNVDLNPIDDVEPDLETLAALLSALDVPDVTVDTVARELYVRQMELFNMEQAQRKSSYHHTHLVGLLGRLRTRLFQLQGFVLQDPQSPSIQVATDLLELQIPCADLPSIRNHETASRRDMAPSSVTINAVKEQEAIYTELRKEIALLDTRVLTYHGLPNDVALARQELDARKEELERLSQIRDGLFEDLVQRESPAKKLQHRTR